MKKIVWENWNEKEKELLEVEPFEIVDEEEDEEIEQLMKSAGNALTPIIGDFGPTIIQTPFGAVNAMSILKPSDRWECWLAYTNFDLTNKISDRIKVINGVEALKIMSRYTFCVGVGKLFDFTSVKKEIENAICKQQQV